MTLLRNLVLVKLAPTIEQRQTASGLFLEPAMTPAVCYGKVVAAGPYACDVTAGDIVVFSPSDGEDVGGFKTPHLVIAESQIAFVVEKESACV